MMRLEFLLERDRDRNLQPGGFQSDRELRSDEQRSLYQDRTGENAFARDKLRGFPGKPYLNPGFPMGLVRNKQQAAPVFIIH